MIQADSRRFIPAAMLFLVLCVCVLSLAATSTLFPWSGDRLPQLRAKILFSLLH